MTPAQAQLYKNKILNMAEIWQKCGKNMVACQMSLVKMATAHGYNPQPTRESNQHNESRGARRCQCVKNVGKTRTNHASTLTRI